MATVFLSITVYLLDTYEVFREEPTTNVFHPMGKTKQPFPVTPNPNSNAGNSNNNGNNNYNKDNNKGNNGVSNNADKENVTNRNINSYKKYFYHQLPELEGSKTQTAFVKTQVKLIWTADIICNIIFAFDFLMRVCSCPYQAAFWMDILNLADFVSLCGFLIICFMTNLHKMTTCVECYNGRAVMYTLTGAHLMLACRNLRFFRICRVNKSLKILFLSIDRSKKDIALLSLVLVIMSVVFGGLIYYAEIQEEEKFEYFHICFYWAFTTMIMGGYGDVVPKTDSGFVIAALCGLVGILALSMLIAVISGNFGELYARYLDREKHAKEKESIEYNMES